MRISSLLKRRPSPARGHQISPAERYLASGQIPWSDGYSEYREDYIDTVLHDAATLEIFHGNKDLPPGYGFRLDERVIEYPWVLDRLSRSPGMLLDAGATLVYPYLLAHPTLEHKSVVIYTIAPEKWWPQRQNISYIYGDLRSTILRAELFDEIVCISTLEHIGMDNTLIYTPNNQYKEAKTDDFRIVVREFHRLLRPGGKVFITLPFGRYENHGWLQQFDRNYLQETIQSFGGELGSLSFFKYETDGWRTAKEDDCSVCRYFDSHTIKQLDSDYAAAARAVACLELIKGR